MSHFGITKMTYLLLALIFALPVMADHTPSEWRAIAAPENSLLFYFLRGDDCVFTSSISGSGPNWSNVAFSSHEKAQGDELTLTAPFVVNQAAGQIITVKQRVWKSAVQEISFTYELSADKDVPLMELNARIAFEKLFQDGDVLITHSDGTQATLPLSFGNGAQPTSGTLLFRSKTAGDLSVTINPPQPITYHGVLHIVLAADVFKAGAKSVTITFHAPAPTSLLVSQTSVDQYMQSRATPEQDRVFRVADSHPFAPGGDVTKSLLDMRGLNEKVAGQSGFVHLNPTGEQFLLGDGTPVRFWAINSSFHGDDHQVAEHARWLASMGVNMVRISGATLQSKAPASQVTDVAQDSLQKIWRMEAALKTQGIYTTIHPYWGNGSGADLTNWGIDGYSSKDQPWGLLFFNKELQRGYRAWLKELFTRPNPYTGIPLAKDPAVAVFILQNEDSLLFWTSQGIKPAQKAVLGALFVEWLKTKYGSLDAAEKAWGGEKLTADRPVDGVLALYDIFQATIPQTGGKGKRIADQYQFFVETMRRFNTETAEYLRKDLGCRMLICAENWRTANDPLMLDAERWAYTADDIVAKNHYFNGIHEGGASGWAVNKGDVMADQSVLYSPWMFPVNMKQVAGHPNIITESTWNNPNLYQSEAPFLVAAYSALSGLNGFYWFASSRAPGYEQPPMSKFPVAQPMTAGMFPAAALLYRKGYVQQAPAVIHEERTLDDLWARKPSAISEGTAFDPNRDAKNASGQMVAATQADPLSFLVGRVEVRPDGDPAKTVLTDTSKFIDTKDKVIRSSTGELMWNFGSGVCTINAPKAQGVCGFLKPSSPFKLADVQIDSADPYASVLVVPLDDQPLKQSKKVLIQVGTTSRPTNWQTEPTFTRPAGATANGERIVNTGSAPWLIGNVHLTVRITNAALTKGELLDSAGCPLREVAVQRDGADIAVSAPADTMYMVLSAE